jgi:hypothetical protein
MKRVSRQWARRLVGPLCYDCPGAPSRQRRLVQGEYPECSPSRCDLRLAKLPQFIEDAYDNPLQFANAPAPENGLLSRAPHSHLTTPSREADLTGPFVTAVPRCRKATT